MDLGPVLLRTTWFFQFLAAFPIFLWLGISTFVNIYQTYEGLYAFIKHICTCLLAGAIVFVILVQWRIRLAQTSKSLAWRFEGIKAACATSLWLWYFLDAALAPEPLYNCFYDRKKRVDAAAAFVILLP